MNSKIISIIGIGFVGDAMMKSYEIKGYKSGKNMFIYDKYKNGGMGNFDDTLKSDIMFLALPTMYDENQKTYNMSAVEDTCELLVKNNYKGAVVIKCTMLPESTNNLCDKYKLNFIHNPEFLTARTAFEDFHNQSHIVLGKGSTCSQEVFDKVVDFYNILYPNTEMSLCDAGESESMKIFVNCFYSVKVQMMTEFYLFCKDTDISYDNVKNMMLKNGWISPMHTQVPGPDKKLSYGGLCFPKDTNALNQMMINKNCPNKVLAATIEERNIMRNDNLNIIKDSDISQEPSDRVTQYYTDDLII
jgi:UDP-glucose 6-dehydrogenase